MRELILAALLLVAGCRNERPPAPTAQQSDQLNEAENMLNAMDNGQQNQRNSASD